MELVPPSRPSRKAPVRSSPAYFKPSGTPAQPELLPRSLDEMVEPDDAVRSVMALLPGLDLSALEARRSRLGGIAYDPRTLLGIWILALWDGERRSRRVERACKTDVRYMLLAGGLTPDHATLCRFRREVAGFLPELLAQTVQGALRAGIASLERACVDGTRIPAASSQWRKLLEEAEEADRADGSPAPKDPNEPKEPTEPPIDRNEPPKDPPTDEGGKGGEGGKKSSRRARKPSTDPEARTLRTRKGFVEGFNAQALSDVSSGLLLATDLSSSGDDSVRLCPLLATFLDRHEELPAEIALDAGYDSPANAEALDGLGVVGYVSPKDRDFDLCLDEEGRIVCPHGVVLARTETFAKNEGRRTTRRLAYCPECKRERTISCAEGVDPAPWVRQRARSKTEEARQARADRGSTAEWLFARVKSGLGLTRFLLRGEKGAKAEFDLAGLAHNLQVLLRKVGPEGLAKLLREALALIYALLAAFQSRKAALPARS